MNRSVCTNDGMLVNSLGKYSQRSDSSYANGTMRLSQNRKRVPLPQAQGSTVVVTEAWNGHDLGTLLGSSDQLHCGQMPRGNLGSAATCSYLLHNLHDLAVNKTSQLARYAAV